MTFGNISSFKNNYIFHAYGAKIFNRIRIISTLKRISIYSPGKMM